MNSAKLLRLLKIHEGEIIDSWDDDADWLYANDFINLDESETPEITSKGRNFVAFIVKMTSEL